MSEGEPAGESVSQKRLFIPSIAVSALAIAISNTIVTLLLLEIASTFQIEEGIAVQIRTINAVAEMIFALLIGFLAVHFKHKSLLLTGVILTAISAVGTFFASTLNLMLIFSFLEGSGTVIVTIMMFTIIGDSLPLNKKSKAAIWVIIAGFISTLVGTPTINYIANVSNWRYAFLLLTLPISIAGLILTMHSIPTKKTKQQQPKIDKTTYFKLTKQVFKNKSAASYLLSSIFFTGIGNAIFVIAFFRQQFLLPREYVVYIILVGASIYIVSGLVTSRLGKKISTKTMTIIGALGSGILIIMIFSATDIWTALIFNFVQAFLTAMAISAYPCLALDQVPASRSTMMSLTRIFVNAGNIIAPAIGGSILILFSVQPLGVGYQAVGFTFGVMNIIAAAILWFFTKDPTKSSVQSVNAMN